MTRALPLRPVCFAKVTMNFLLYMLEAVGRNQAVLRPIGRTGLRTAAARHAADGHWREALDDCRRLADSCGETTIDKLVRGQLHFVCGERPEAAHCFVAGIDRLLAAGDEEQTSIGQWVEDATELLRQGRYARATDVLVRARTILDVVMTAEAGVLLAQEQNLEQLAGLVRLSDLTLRMLARTVLARQVAQSLETRRLRSDLAPWATPANRVQELLAGEQRRLAELVAQWPDHAEWQYRLALISRAAGDAKVAAAAFERVLAVYPHHVPAAVGLAATLEKLGQPGGRKTLERALRVPAETMRLFADFAQAAGGEAAFDQLAEKTCAGGAGAAAVRGNLALALSEMGLLDAPRETWREFEPAATN